MSSNLQLVASIVIAGIFLIGILFFYGGVVDYSNEKMFQLHTQETTASLMEIIDHDFRRIGSGLATPSVAILDTSEITFLGDVDENGAVDTVRYYVSSLSDANSTPNPNDVILYRVVNGFNTIDTPAGVTNFEVTFLDESGLTTNDMMAVRALHVNLRVESLYPYDNNYEIANWEKRITPQNLYRMTLTDY
ncbi:MAG: hypothetical protein ACE5IR_12340 [bacterium]